MKKRKTQAKTRSVRTSQIRRLPLEKSRRSVLKNGMVLLTEHAKHFQTLAIGFWVRTGSRHESPKMAGMAHFLEHMMFKGTDKRSALEIARAVDLVGGDFNAMTAREYTCFHISLPVQELNFALELMTEILTGSRFEADELERERQVILQEMYGSLETPEEYIDDVMMEVSYGSHPLGRNILGTEETVKSFNQKDVVRFFKTHYSAKNMLITMAGDLDHSKVKATLNHLLKDFKGEAVKPTRATLRKPKFFPGVHVIHREMEQCHVEVVYESNPIQHPDRLATFLLNSFLGGGMSSAIFQSIREQHGLAYTVYSSLLPATDSGLLILYVATSADLVPMCLKLMQEEVARLMEQPIAEEDLEIVKSSIKSAIQLSSDSMDSRMMALAKSEMFLGKHLSNEALCRQIDRVTVDDLWRVALELFTRKSRVVVLGNITAAKVNQALG